MKCSSDCVRIIYLSRRILEPFRHLIILAARRVIIIIFTKFGSLLFVAWVASFAAFCFRVILATLAKLDQ